MTRLTALAVPAAAAAALAAAAWAGPAAATGSEPACRDFPTRAAAQRYWDTHGRNLPGFDNNGNGIVCEHRFPPSQLPPPASPSPAPEHSVPPVPASPAAPKSPAAAVPPPAAPPAAPARVVPARQLPITGPATAVMFVAGLLCVTVGAGAVLVSRRRRTAASR